MGFNSKAESASHVSAAPGLASIAPPLGFFTGALGKQSDAETPSFAFGVQRSREQAVLMDQLAQIVQSASPTAVSPPSFSFGSGRAERQNEAGKQLSPIPVILSTALYERALHRLTTFSSLWRAASRCCGKGILRSAVKATSCTHLPAGVPPGSTVQPTSALGAKTAAGGVSNGAAKVSPVEEQRHNSEAEQAAAVKLPPESDTDDDAATAAGQISRPQQNGFLQPNAGGKQEAKMDQGTEQEENKPAAAATGGWDASFLAKNKATLVSATAAMAEEIDRKAKGESDIHSIDSTVSLHRHHKPVAEGDLLQSHQEAFFLFL